MVVTEITHSNGRFLKCLEHAIKVLPFSLGCVIEEDFIDITDSFGQYRSVFSAVFSNASSSSYTVACSLVVFITALNEFNYVQLYEPLEEMNRQK
jgi:hypothetical protein